MEASPDATDADLPAFLGVDQSATGRRWRSRLTDERAAIAISQRLGVAEIIGRVLAARGVAVDAAADYLSPSLKQSLPDPSRFKDMDLAGQRIAEAIISGEKVAVFGDYDVDGATSSALLARFFEAVGRDLRVYIPDRLKEGYGPTAPALLALKDEGVSLVVTVDCGTMAHKPLAEAAAAGLDIVVVDHHQTGPDLPTALAVVNPNRLDEDGEYGNLAAVGVAFVLVVAINRALRAAGWYSSGGGRREPGLLQWLDLVALGTVCDVVPLTGLNRALVAQGLKVMAKRRNTGLAALGDVSRLTEPPGTYHAGFLLGPRVNAGGRVGASDLGVRLLTTRDAEEAQRIALELDALNKQRQEIEAAVEETALGLAMARLSDDGTPPPVVCVASEGWHAGVIGIVASRIKEKLGRPTFVIALADGEGKGSGRSIPGVDLGAAVTAARQAGLLVGGGGHAMAAGLTVKTTRLAELEAFLCERLAPSVQAAVANASLGIDGALALRGATVELADQLAQAGPFGAGNPEPRFVLSRVSVVRADMVGRNHVRCVLSGNDGGRLTAIAFRAADNALGQTLVTARGALHIAGRLRADSWQGKPRVQFTIDDATRV